MQPFTRRRALAFTVSVCASSSAIAIGTVGCSSSTPGTTGATTALDSGAIDSGSVAPTTCTNPTLEVGFGPNAYSAFIPNSAKGHTFEIPFVLFDGTGAAYTGTGPVTWIASDPTKVAFQTGAGAVDLGGSNAPAVMVTTQGAGDVDIIAQAGGQCGISKLHIASVTDDDWTIGDNRYNNGTILVRGGNGGLIAQISQDGGTDAKCTNCHGALATMAQYKTVEHTPQQTGGFSDQDLIGIFTMAVVPPGGYFDTTIVSQSRWTQFHQWTMTPDQEKGIVVYLRALTPSPQTGAPNPLPRMRPDGGRMMMGMGAPDATAQQGNDAALDEAAAPAPEASTPHDASPPVVEAAAPHDASPSDGGGD